MLILYIADVERDVGMKKLTQEEAVKVIEGMKVKIEIPKAAVTQWKRNTALDMAIEALKYSEVPNSSDCISRADVDQTVEDNILCYTHSDRAIDQDPDTECHMAIRTALRMLRKDLRKLPSAQPEQRYTEEELRVFAHGISLSLLSKRSAQHWKYDEDTATEIKFLERLYEKVGADMKGRQG